MTFSTWLGLVVHISRRKWILPTLAIGFYILVFLSLFNTFGAALAALSVVPTALFAWFYGLRVGCFTTFLTIPLNIVLMSLVRGLAGALTLQHSAIPGTLAIAFVVLLIGQIRVLNDKLREAEAVAYQLSDAAFEAIVIHDQGRILAVNQAFCQMYGFERQEIVGKNALDLTAPEFREFVRRKIAEGDTTPYEGIALRKDGSQFDAEVMGRPIVYHGKNVRVTAIHDITERKQAKKMVEQERALLRILIDHLPHRIFYKDVQGHFLLINAALAQIYHVRTPEEVVGKSVFDFYPLPLAEQLHADDMKVLRTDHPLTNHELVGLDEQKNAVSLVVTKVPVHDDQGQVTGLIGISMDITERKQVETQRLAMVLAQEKADFLKDFLNTMSHDLKTPLSVINTSLYLVERLTDPQLQKEKLQTIKKQVSHLGNLIEDILTMSRLDTLPDLEFGPVNVTSLICDIEQNFRALVERKQLTLRLSLLENLPLVQADSQNLNRVLINLIENALNYTPNNGGVFIQTCVEGQYVVFEIADTGIGIQESELDHIFEPFYRSDQARITHATGTGLGLAIVKKIVDLHNGHITVASQAGSGSTFRLFLPVSKT
jgi:PAS domain S-box-containing protein